jgi:AcrR family transcriptional regulator
MTLERTTSRPRRRRRSVGRPPESDSAETRARILEVALRHFARDGYRGTSIKSVAHAADLTTGAVYYHFESKADLYRAVGRDLGVSGLADEYEKLASQIEDRDVADSARALIQALCDRAATHLDLHKLGVATSIEADRYPVIADTRDAWAKELDRLYRRIAGATGPAGSDPEADRVAVFIEVLALGISLFVSRPGGVERLPTVMSAFDAMVDGTLFPRRRLDGNGDSPSD